MRNRNDSVKQRDIFNNPIVTFFLNCFVLTATTNAVLEKGLFAGLLIHCAFIVCWRVCVQVTRDWTAGRKGAERGK
ncbi:hypothetical protein Pr1d_50630 [Bythopirellula goksoeyrii]|uniref:Uncharacterized protein n=1 Tax=Bythopirellula goksoeyrii TaxID=1400387 RepID=A0A5B9QF95_9BACT|nr:hypothetical protein Pr1d_50630 [Bythopirellula goksoeyrii]